MKSEQKVFRWAMSSVILLVVLVGCGRDGAASSQDVSDRVTPAYQQAMEDIVAGRTDAAVRGFERVIREQPGNANARFQLATLYDEKKIDIIGAIANYREYVIMRPDSDKAAIARERAKRCEMLYANELTAHCDAVVALSNALSVIKKEHAGCLERIAAAEAMCVAADEWARKAEVAVLMKERLLAGMKDDPNPIKKPPKIIPTDAELLDAEDDGSRIQKGEVDKLRAELDAEEKLDVKNEFAQKKVAPTNAVPFFAQKKQKLQLAHPDHYTVQEGDTLMHLALRFYGTKSAWRKIQSANRAIVSTDGRIQVGQTLVLPE